jgi:hypothetical protein
LSSWQSFFNKLSKPANQESYSISEYVCQCDQGELAVSTDTNFVTSGECCLDLFCSLIQIDKFKAQTFVNRISISVTKEEPKKSSENNSLEHFLNNSSG